MIKGKKDIKITKIEAEPEVLVKRGETTKGLQNKIRKLIRAKNTLHQRNQEIHGKENKQKFGNSFVLQNKKKNIKNI